MGLRCPCPLLFMCDSGTLHDSSLMGICIVPIPLWIHRHSFVPAVLLEDLSWSLLGYRGSDLHGLRSQWRFFVRLPIQYFPFLFCAVCLLCRSLRGELHHRAVLDLSGNGRRMRLDFDVVAHADPGPQQADDLLTGRASMVWRGAVVLL